MPRSRFFGGNSAAGPLLPEGLRDPLPNCRRRPGRAAPGTCLLRWCLEPALSAAGGFFTFMPIVLTPRSPEVGGDVSLAPQNLPQDVLVCSWYRSATTHESSRILTYYPPPAPDQIPGPAHTGRETAGPGCTLHIAGLTLSDTGNYTTSPRRPHSPALPGEKPGVLAPSPSFSNPPAPPPLPSLICSWITALYCRQAPGSESSTGLWGRSPVQRGLPWGLGWIQPLPPVTLSLFPEMLPRPTVTPDQTQVLENGTFTLTCNSSPSADTVLWLRDGASLAPSERLGLSPENRTLMVPNVTRGDAGTYQCEVGNPVSSVRSEPSTVMVAYGPDSARIDLPGPIALTLRSPLNLTCVSDSVPAPSYRWVLNGTDTNETRIILTFNPTTWAQQGTYKCRAHNPITNRTAWGSVAQRAADTGIPGLAPMGVGSSG
uniref:Ig-like domain-containing protein n=1 Tax=Terrapene triunguis TaxID=2587831 RepID=A0A674J7B3_9SAUR